MDQVELTRLVRALQEAQTELARYVYDGTRVVPADAFVMEAVDNIGDDIVALTVYAIELRPSQLAAMEIDGD